MQGVIDQLFSSENNFNILFSWLPEPILNIVVAAILIIFVWLGISIIIKIIGALT